MRHYEIKVFSRFSRFLAVFVSFSYFSSYYATTENQVLHAYKDWTGLISKDVLSKDVLSSAEIISSEDINESVSLDVNVNVSLDISEDMTDIADMAVSNDIPASSDNDSNDNFDSNDNSFISFDNLLSNDTNDTGNTADTEGVVESVRLWLDNEIDKTVILDGISILSDDTINTISNGNDSGSSSNDSNNSNNGFSSRAADGSNSNRSSQPDQPRLAVPLSPVLSEAASSDLAAISDTVSDAKNIPAASTDTATAPFVLGHTLDSFIGLDQLASPVIVILPSTNEQYYFANGKALAAYDRFDQEYKISEINATTRAEIEIRLVRK